MKEFGGGVWEKIGGEYSTGFIHGAKRLVRGLLVILEIQVGSIAIIFLLLAHATLMRGSPAAEDASYLHRKNRHVMPYFSH